VVARSRTSLIFINQIREKIGVMFGNPETTTGGRALKFYASVRIDIRRIGQIKEGDQDIGSRTRVKVVKNKMAPPFKLAEFDILYGQGISRTGDLIDLAITHRLIDKSGAWFSYGETRLGQGRENVRQFLEQNADLRDEIDAKLRRLLGLVKEPRSESGADAKAAKEAGREIPGARDTAPGAASPEPRDGKGRDATRPGRAPAPGARA
jgi:recombination protein RecA